jgi:hypothetical protein
MVDIFSDFLKGLKGKKTYESFAASSCTDEMTSKNILTNA